MGDQDWLDEGHGAGDSLQSMIKGTSPVAADRASIRSVLRGADSARPRASRRRNKALVGWLLYCFTAVGGTAAAFTVRDTLFPSLGAPTTQKVWDKGTDTTATTEHGSSSTAEPESTVGETTVVVTTIAVAVESETIPTVATPPQGPASSIDNSGPSGAVAPAPGTTVADSSKGPGPGTTVADNPTETSTPATTPTSAAPVTSASTPVDPADGGSQNGKGGGSGGGGGGGGDHDAPPTP